jgi:hypothetical protein
MRGCCVKGSTKTLNIRSHQRGVEMKEEMEKILLNLKGVHSSLRYVLNEDRMTDYRDLISAIHSAAEVNARLKGVIVSLGSAIGVEVNFTDPVDREEDDEDVYYDKYGEEAV